MKQCNKCKIIRSADEFSRDARSKDRLQSRCKGCQREYRQANADRIAVHAAEYYKDNADRIKKQSREYQIANIDRVTKYRAEYYKANKDKILNYQKEYQQANIERIIEYRIDYRQTNADKIAQHMVKYRKMPEGKAVTMRHKAKRRAALDATEVTLTADEWTEIEELYHGLCAYCGIAPGITQDHIIPLVPRQGEPRGTHTQNNVVPACTSCNSSKLNRPIEVWKPGWKPLRVIVLLSQ